MRFSASGLPRKITKLLMVVVVFLTMAHVAGQVSKYYFGYDTLLGLIPAFDLNGEWNIPAWYSSCTLFLCGVLLGWIAYFKGTNNAPYAHHWAGLSIIFVMLSLDEAVSIHETWSHSVRDMFGLHGFLYFAWVVPGAIFALVVALAYVRFLKHLPSETRRLFILAGAVYVGGAIGMEAVGAPIFQRYGRNNIPYAILVTVEEFLEMFGVVIFTYALLSYGCSQVQEAGLWKDELGPRESG